MTEEPAYREELPEGCPPEEAGTIEGGTVVFRLVRTDPPTRSDFDSWRALNAEKPLPQGVCECQARGVSVHDNRQASVELKKIPKFRNHLIARLSLEASAGRIKKTGRRGHCLWWPYTAFDILLACEVLP